MGTAVVHLSGLFAGSVLAWLDVGFRASPRDWALVVPLHLAPGWESLARRHAFSLKNLPQPKLGGTIPMEMSVPAEPPPSHLLLIGEPLTSPGRFLHCLPDLTIIKHFLLFSPVFFLLNFKPLVLVLPKIYY